jgi:hypothetical protein
MTTTPKTWNLQGVAQVTGLVLVVFAAFAGLMLLTGKTEGYLGAVIYFALLSGRLLIYLLIVPHLMPNTDDNSGDTP